MSRPNQLVSLVLASTVTFALAACSRSEADPRAEAPLVETGSVGQTGATERAFTGIVSARVQSALGFRVSGKIVERLVDAGQVVRRGQPLMRIDRTDLALANVAQAGAVAAAQAKALQTGADEKRYRDLVSAGAVSASAYDGAKAASDAAHAQLVAAQAQAGVSRNEASYSVLVADADGTVVETFAEPGQVVAAGQTVVRLARSGPREATISLPETIRPAVGSIARATTFGASVSGSARLRQLSDAADPQTRTYDARYVLEGAAAAAPLGSTVTIQFADAKTASAMQIPIAAIFDNGKGPGVWVVQGRPSRVIWRTVQLAGLGDETATITGGLAAGETFVALGAHLLHQDQAVRLAGDKVASK
jgi:RND family efflux transporter MFP subunit